MTPQKLLQWVRSAASGEGVVYYAGQPNFEAALPAVFATARSLHEEGKVLLYQRHRQWCAQKISTRAKRFIDHVSRLTLTPPMGPYGLFAAGKGPDPDKRSLNNETRDDNGRRGGGAGKRRGRAAQPEAPAE